MDNLGDWELETNAWDDDFYTEEDEWEGVGWLEDLLTPLDKYESLR